MTSPTSPTVLEAIDPDIDHAMLLINTVTSCEQWLRHLSTPIVKAFAPAQAVSP
jgi:hypothetical protein